MLDLASTLGDLPEKRGQAPWPEHEYVKGWGLFGLPFDSGHVLALRVFPQSDFGPYRRVWHRDPAGGWSIYVDGPRLDTACPRYYGAACAHTGLVSRRGEVVQVAAVARADLIEEGELILVKASRSLAPVLVVEGARRRWDADPDQT
jgi:hypothetical protein